MRDGVAGRRSLMDVLGWETFLHGVFAIAITLLILDIRVPAAASVADGKALVDALTEELPRYFAYVLGFMYVGTYWIATHRVLRLMRGVDHWFLVLGLIYLMVIAAVPFATALLAEYIGKDAGREQVALVVFTSWQLLLSILANATLRYATSRERLLSPGVTRASLRRFITVSAFGPAIWVIAIASSVIAGGAVTLVLMAGVLLLFLQEVPTTENLPLGSGPTGAAEG